MPEATPKLPKAEKPQNTAATLAGGLPLAAILVWNHFQPMIEKCWPEGSTLELQCTMVPGPLYIPGEIYAPAVLVLTAITGPLRRKYLRWADKGDDTADLDDIRHDITALEAAVPALEKKLDAGLEKIAEALERLEK